MTLTCGQNVFAHTVKGSSGGCATERDALDAALSDLLWNSLLDALLDLRDKTRLECPAACPKKVYDQPRLRLTKYVTIRDPQGGFGCELELELREWVACTPEARIALVDDVPALGTLSVTPLGSAYAPSPVAVTPEAPGA